MAVTSPWMHVCNPTDIALVASALLLRSQRGVALVAAPRCVIALRSTRARNKLPRHVSNLGRKGVAFHTALVAARPRVRH